MTDGLGLSETREHVAIARTQRSIWAEKSPLRNSMLYQDGIVASVFTIFAVLCAIPVLSLLIRPIYHLGICANRMLGWIRLRRYICRYPKLSVMSCQVGAFILSSNWWPPNLWFDSLAGVSVTISFWVLVLSILLFALPKLGSYPLTLEGIRLHVERKWPERWFASRMRNSLDAYFVREVILSTLTMVPAWIILFQHNAFYPMNCLFFVISFGQNGMRHEVIDHTNMHNRLFWCKKNATRFTRCIFRLTNIYLAYILNPLNLRVPFFYNVHHLYIHHAENNGVDDVQSTVLYDRRSFFDFCKFSMFFALDYTAGFMTISYLIKKAKYRPIKIAVGGLIFWYGAVVGLWLLDPVAATFILCYRFATLLGSSFGAFGWHGFVDTDDPENILRNTINIVSPDIAPSNDTHNYFGNYYHIVHHLRPGLHWSKMAHAASGSSEEYTTRGALQWHLGGGTFSGERIMKAIWLNRLDVLLPFFADWNIHVSDAESLKIIHERTRPIFPVAHSAFYARLDRKLGGFVARYLLVDKLPRKGWRDGIRLAEMEH